MGLGVASCLVKAGAHVDVVARRNTVAALREQGLKRTGIFGQYHAEPTKFGSYMSLNEIPEGTYDHVLVCVKSFDTFEAALELSAHTSAFGNNTKIILFQNGWGNAEKFCSFFEARQIYSARVITGFRRVKPNEVEITVHADSIHIGSLFAGDLSGIQKLCELIAQGDIPCRKTDSIEKDLWAKMLYNCALNALGAILDVPYGILAQNEFTRVIMDGIVEETFAVMKASGHRTYWGSAADFLNVFYNKLVPDTAGHQSSTLQDILAKKKTEIDALNGAVLKLAQQHAMKVPYNSAVYNIVKFIESKSP